MLCSRQLLYVTLVLGVCTGCQGVLGLNDYRVQAEQPVRGSDVACSSHVDCQNGEGADPASVCTPERRCVSARSAQCDILTKPVRDAQALVLGSLFATRDLTRTAGSGGAYNAARQSAVVMAVDEINERGGVPALGGGAPRKLILVSCDASGDDEAAGRQLVKLGAIAVVGPAESEAVLNVSMKHTIAAGILLGLELLVAADIIGTVIASPTLMQLSALGLIVLIRTFLSLALQVELEGRLPWQRIRADTADPR